MNPKLILTAVIAATVLFGSAQDTASRPKKTKPVTVFLLRHAEAGDRSKTDDPALSAAGEQRAKALARLLGSAEITHLFATEYKRTQLTLVPLARSTSLRVQVISSRKREEQLRALRSLPGGATAVVAGLLAVSYLWALRSARYMNGDDLEFFDDVLGMRRIPGYLKWSRPLRDG